MTNSIRVVIAVTILVPFLSLVSGLTSAASAQEQQDPPSITMTVNQSKVMHLERRAKRVSVTQPEIAEVVVVAPNELLLNGKSVGTTSLVVWDELGVSTTFTLTVRRISLDCGGS